MPTAVLPNLLAASILVVLATVISIRRPPRPLWPSLLFYQLFVLLYIVGDAITLVSRDMPVEQLGIAVLYSGSLPAGVTCWILALRYAEAEGLPFEWARGPWTSLPIAWAVTGWLVMLSNPWHGLFVDPVIGAHNGHGPLWWAFVPIGYALVNASLLLYAVLAWRANDPQVKRNAATMSAAIFATLVFNFLSYAQLVEAPFDLTVVGLGVTSVIFLIGAYRARLFSLLPIALPEIIRHDPDGVVLIDRRGLLLHANPAASDLLGLSGEALRPGAHALSQLEERLVGNSGDSLGPQTLIPDLLEGLPEARSPVVRFDPAAGRWLQLEATPIPSRRGRWIATSLRVQDITEARHVAKALRHTRNELEDRVRERTGELMNAVAKLESEIVHRQHIEGELRESEERYRTVSAVSSDLSFSFRLWPNGRVTTNWMTRNRLPFQDLEAPRPDGATFLAAIHPDDHAQLPAIVERIRRGESGQVEIRVPLAEDLHWIDIHYKPMDTDSDGAIRVIGSIRDITDRKNEEATRRQLELHVQETQRLDSLGVLAGGVAHDFNNMLSVVLGNSRLALQELPEGSPVRTRLERIRSVARHAARLTEQMLVYAGKSKLESRPLDLGDVVRETLELLRAGVASESRIEISLDRALPLVLADTTRIQQVLVNLVTNASEALHDGRGRIRVATGTAELKSADLVDAFGASDATAGLYVYLEISDDGSGMDETARRRVFEPFFTTKFTGRGLGLPAVLGIVRAHGGVIRLTSTPGEGSAFRVLLPPAQTVEHESQGRATTAPSHPGDATVLVVDDDEAVLELAAEFLRRAGHHPITARGGLEALDLLTHSNSGSGSDSRVDVDVVVLDLSMPDIDGRETYRRIRAVRPDVPIILASGYEPELARELLDDPSGRTSFLSKPYEPEALLESVKGAVQPRVAQ